MHEFQARARTLVQDGTLSFDQRLRRLAALATEALPYPDLSPDCREALDKRIICDMYEGNAPYTARYILTDYELALRQGLRYLEMAPPTNLVDALAFLQVMYANVPSVTTYPVYLGDLDTLLAPFVTADLTGAFPWFRPPFAKARGDVAGDEYRHQPAADLFPADQLHIGRSVRFRVGV